MLTPEMSRLGAKVIYSLNAFQMGIVDQEDIGYNAARTVGDSIRSGDIHDKTEMAAAVKNALPDDYQRACPFLYTE